VGGNQLGTGAAATPAVQVVQMAQMEFRVPKPREERQGRAKERPRANLVKRTGRYMQAGVVAHRVTLVRQLQVVQEEGGEVVRAMDKAPTI